MASNHPQIEPTENPALDISLDRSNSSTTTTAASNLPEHQQTEQAGRLSGCNSDHDGKLTLGEKKVLTNNGLYPSISGYNLVGDTHLIQSRRINFNQGARKDLQLMCEDKISRYKLEEVHCSEPSSMKPTFIMTFSPDGRKVASTHGDHCIYICDLSTGKLLDTLEGHPKTPWCLAWHPSNREILASGCLAGEVRVWDLKSKACESWTSENNTIIASLDFHPKERILVIATANDIHFWDWSESEPFAKTTTTHDKEKVKFVEFDSSGTKLVTGISNLPKYAGHSSDSLQNRIIDSYLHQGSLDQLQTQENMTQNSEITNSPSGSLNPNETFNDRNATQLTLNRLTIPGINNNEQDINYTLSLSRVATLYRQLETLEDSMRHTSFSPYVNPRPISTIDPPERETASNNQERDTNSQSAGNTSNGTFPESSVNDRSSRAATAEASTHAPQEGNDQTSNQPTTDSQPNRVSRAPNAFEPFVVSFDESLEQLQLMPLVLDGQTINLATVIEQYPIDVRYHIHYVMQYDSINQVNQNFIRISKLMSSVRLYRQVVQQILSSNHGQVHYQPNQILTAQSSSPKSSRHNPNLPIVFRNFNPIASSIETNRLVRGARSTDPILAIQFRNSARNVPLVTICKIDLLSARCVCITRSQQLIEQAISGSRSATADEQASTDEMSNTVPSELIDQSNHSQASTGNSRMSNIDADPSLHLLLSQIHQCLTVINHAPLTTSNVHSHICSLRSLINRLLTTMLSMFQSQQEGQRLVNLIHDIAHSLTGRNWSIPLGATLDDIRLDVIHTLCIVDLTLHLARQVQLLQMQRLSAVARINVSRRAITSPLSGETASRRNEARSNIVQSEDRPVDESDRPGTSRDSLNINSANKRKESEISSSSEDAIKRRKFVAGESTTNMLNPDIEMIDTQTSSSTLSSVLDRSNINGQGTHSTTYVPQAVGLSSTLQAGALPSDTLSSDRFVLWNSSPSTAVEQSLQRFLVATASNMSSNHILVRIYHRSHASPILQPSNVPEQSVDRPIPMHHEFNTRRRALSQDNSQGASGQEVGTSLPSTDQGRGSRQGHHATPTSANGPGVSSFETWQRHPHLHVYQTRGTGQHLWFNQWTIPLPGGNFNYRLQCWNFSPSTIPSIKDSQSNVVTQRCRIHNDASIDISSDGSLVACLVPQEDGGCLPSFDLKVFSLKAYDFGLCYYQVSHGPNAISVSMSPSAEYAVVGLASHKFISNDPRDDDLTIAKVLKLSEKNPYGCVRDIKIKRDDSSLSLNAIRWMSRGIVYNVGPQHHQRYHATRVRNRA